VLAAIARMGSDQDRSELVDRAKATGAESRWAFEALIEAKAEIPIWAIFEQGLNPLVRALALEHLAAGPDRNKALEQALAPGLLPPLRRAAVSLLDPSDENELPKLMTYAETDRDPLVRRGALERLSSLKDSGLKPFFEARAGGDEDQSVRAYARQLAEALGG